jgi:hypothetical protein
VIAIIHLSDIHLRVVKNSILYRSKAIVDSVFAVEPDLGLCIIALTGDVAFSGQAQEYQLALEFVIAIQEAVAHKNPSARTVVVAVPGNHDCDFSGDLTMRNLLLPGVIQHIDDDLLERPLEELLKIQKNFFDFRKTVCHPCPDSVLDRLCYTHDIEFDGALIQVHCYNTAFMSKLNEEQGKLLFPLKAAQSNIKFRDEAVLSVSILHHPMNWIESVNETRFTAFLEKTSDVLLTGHQHVENALKKQTLLSKSRVIYIAGDALQEDNPNESGFNTIIFDLPSNRYKIAHVEWLGSLYASRNSSEWLLLERNETIRHLFINNKAFLDQLLELGTGFTHPRRKTLMLADVFVYPDLKPLNFMQEGDGESSEPPPLSAKNLLGHIVKNEITFILGGHQSGKSALAKKVYHDLQKSHKFVPVLTRGEDFGSSNSSAVLKVICQAFEQQYSEQLLEPYKQLDPSVRVIVIDDIDHSRLNRRKGYASLIRTLKSFFSRIVVLADDLFQFEEIAADGDGAIFQLDRLAIMPLTRQQRSSLIEKWNLLDDECTYDARELTQTILNVERFVETLIWKDLLPCHPVFILAALQSYEASRNPSATTSSYGSIYEALLTGALFQQSGSTADVEKDKILLSRLAFFMFSNEVKSVSKSQIEDVCENYSTLYHIKADVNVLIQDATAAQILTSSDSSYRFRYQYSYYYFVGKYFAANLQDDVEGVSLRAKLLEMSDYLYFDEYANVLLFALYLTKDTELINHLVANADQIYGDREACDLDKHVGFLNKIINIQPDTLPDPDARKNREADRHQQDEFEANHSRPESKEKVRYHSELDDVIKLNIAFKTLQLLGQVVRDSPASLKANIKVEVIRAVYQLGLRVLRVVMQDIENSLGHLREYVADVIKDHNNYLTPRELAQATDQTLTGIARQCAFGIIKRISFAVGLERLEQTYKVLLDKFGSVPSIRLVDLSIRLDHFTEYPEANIEKMLKDLRNNYFANRVLRDLVLNQMRLVELDYRTRQRIGEMLGIKHNAPQFLLAPKKGEKAQTSGAE